MYSMLFTVNLGLRDCVWFSQIRSHLFVYCFVTFTTCEPMHTASTEGMALTRHNVYLDYQLLECVVAEIVIKHVP